MQKKNSPLHKVLAEQQLRKQELVFKIFESSSDGRELLAIWRELEFKQPGARPGDGLLEVGMIEGSKAFVRDIVNTITGMKDV